MAVEIHFSNKWLLLIKLYSGRVVNQVELHKICAGESIALQYLYPPSLRVFIDQQWGEISNSWLHWPLLRLLISWLACLGKLILVSFDSHIVLLCKKIQPSNKQLRILPCHRLMIRCNIYAVKSLRKLTSIIKNTVDHSIIVTKQNNWNAPCIDNGLFGG